MRPGDAPILDIQKELVYSWGFPPWGGGNFLEHRPIGAKSETRSRGHSTINMFEKCQTAQSRVSSAVYGAEHLKSLLETVRGLVAIRADRP